jgi:transcriptional regulator with XRE-family HTH domain
MNNNLSEHPAVLFGAWLKGKRRESGIVARVFAGRINLSPAEYAEVESGVGIRRWIGEKQVNLIPLMLGFNEDEEAEFNSKLFLAKEEYELQFADVYSKEELAPARCSTVGGKQIDANMREAIVKAVFTPL